MNLLETTKLIKRYNGRTVVNEVSFVLSQREVVGILGRNGAGKTTTFRMIIGMIRPESGVVTFDGFDVTNLPMYKRARRGMGYLSQEHSIFRQLTVWQNLIAILETLNIKRPERIRRARTLRFLPSRGRRGQRSHRLPAATARGFVRTPGGSSGR